MDDLKVALEELKEESDSGKLAEIPAADTQTAAGGGHGLPRRQPCCCWPWPGRGGCGRQRRPRDLMPVPLTSYSGIEYNPRFRRTATEVAFAWNGEKEDNYDIYVKQIGSAGPPCG